MNVTLLKTSWALTLALLLSWTKTTHSWLRIFPFFNNGALFINRCLFPYLISRSKLSSKIYIEFSACYNAAAGFCTICFFWLSSFTCFTRASHIYGSILALIYSLSSSLTVNVKFCRGMLLHIGHSQLKFMLVLAHSLQNICLHGSWVGSTITSIHIAQSVGSSSSICSMWCICSSDADIRSFSSSCSRAIPITGSSS